MIYNTILCLGDSLTFGARDEYQRGYPAELARLLNEEDSGQFWITINEGKSDERSNGLLRRLVKTLKIYPEAYVVLLEIGTNDTLDFVPLDIYEDTIFQIIKTCQCFGKRVILGSLISLCGLGLLSYSKQGAKLLEEYNIVLKKMASKLHLPFVDLTSLKKLRIDRCHFNNKGYKEMAKLYKKAILEL